MVLAAIQESPNASGPTLGHEDSLGSAETERHPSAAMRASELVTTDTFCKA
jgi:hypothetical protein